MDDNMVSPPTELPTDLTTNTSENYEQAIADYFQEMQRLRQQLNKDQEEIDRLKAETRVMLKQLKAA